MFDAYVFFERFTIEETLHPSAINLRPSKGISYQNTPGRRQYFSLMGSFDCALQSTGFDSTNLKTKYGVMSDDWEDNIPDSTEPVALFKKSPLQPKLFSKHRYSRERY